MRVGHIEVFVADASLSRDWYIKVLGAKVTSDQGEFQWIDISGTELLLRPGKGAPKTSYKETSIALVLYIE